MADLDEIMSGREDASVHTETPVVEQSTEGQSRDEQGRFAASQQEPTEPQAVEPQTTTEQRPPEGFIPIQALDARLAKERERSEAAMRQQAEQFQQMLAQYQQPQRQPEAPKPVPDFFENPDAAVDYRLNQAMQPVQQGQQAIVENFSRMMASDKHGEEAVNTALSELTSRVRANPQGMQFEYQRIMASPHPYGELVKWHKAQTALSTYGDDPTAYREKLRAELLAEMQGGQQQQTTQQTQPQQVMPTSFATARNAGSSSPPAYTGPRPLSDIMGGR